MPKIPYILIIINLQLDNKIPAQQSHPWVVFKSLYKPVKSCERLKLRAQRPLRCQPGRPFGWQPVVLHYQHYKYTNICIKDQDKK